jgi:DNA-directed RNA polymerase, mitochondrial
MSHLYLDPACATQLDLEANMFDLGKQKFMSRLEKERERGQEASTGATARVIDLIYPAVTEKLVEWKNNIETKGKGRNPAAYAPLKDIEPELVTYIGLRVIFDLIMSRGGCTEHKAALTIGSWVEHECRVRAFAKKNKRYLDKMMKAARARSNNADYLRTITVNAMNKKADNWKPWKHGVQVAVGFVVIECLLGCGAFIERDTSQSEIKLYATMQLMDMIDQTNDTLMETQPTVLPCIEKPLPWSTPYDGGFHTENMREKYPLLTAFHRKDRLKLLEKAEMPAVYRAVNTVQSTGWKINEPVLKVMQHLWNTRMDFGVLPEISELELPPRPANIDTDLDVLKQWKRAASEVYTQRVRQGSRRLNLKRTIDVAEQYKDMTLYYVYQCDFRGRLYAQGAGPNPQGTDYQKALLMFAEGKPIGHSGVPWLYIHTANCFGVDKVSLAERIDWTVENMSDILRCAEDPIEYRWWTTADQPWLFLAACYEVAGYMREGTAFITRLPITVDGSCNGLQHYSAMLRDPVGGEATNLVPMSTPQDIYGRVANVTVAKDPTLAGIVTRSVAKRPVMVLPYGGTIASCKDYVRAALRDAGHRFEPERETAIATLVWNSIGDVVVAAKEGMAFLRKMASAMSKKKEHVSWVAPSGWPVLQQYFDLKRNQLDLIVVGKRLRYVTFEPKLDTVDGRRSGQGLPPNFVHSMDAAALVGMVNLGLDEGITQFAVVHDSFGTLACDMDLLGGCIRTSFVNMYVNHDVLEELRQRVAEVVGPRMAKHLPPVPEKGKLDINGVLESPFFFA